MKRFILALSLILSLSTFKAADFEDNKQQAVLLSQEENANFYASLSEEEQLIFKSFFGKSKGIKIQSGVLRTIVIGVCLAFFSLAIFAVFNLNFAVDAAEAEHLKLVKEVAREERTRMESNALARASIFARMPSVKEAFLQNKREQLYGDVKEAYQIQKEKYGVGPISFVSPDKTIFLRMHEPEKFGDDVY